MAMAESQKTPAPSLYQCPPHVVWAVERKGIFLLDKQSGSFLHLDYPQAAVWDLINRSYSFHQTIRMLCAIACMHTAQARQLMMECLDAWTQAGFLIREDGNG
jgi:hypothetical protein